MSVFFFYELTQFRSTFQTPTWERGRHLEVFLQNQQIFIWNFPPESSKEIKPTWANADFPREVSLSFYRETVSKPTLLEQPISSVQMWQPKEIKKSTVPEAASFSVLRLETEAIFKTFTPVQIGRVAIILKDWRRPISHPSSFSSSFLIRVKNKNSDNCLNLSLGGCDFLSLASHLSDPRRGV